MASPTPTLTPVSGPNLDSPPKGLGPVFEVVAKLATSWVGLLTAYAGAITAAVLAFQKLQEPLKGLPVWLRAALVAALPLLALVFHVIPSLIEQRRKRLIEITGHLQTGYFCLAPRDDEASFQRADGKHLEILRWLQENKSPVLYVTGLSGSGKSSLLTAWVLPNIERQNTLVIRLRGYQDPLTVLEQELQKPGRIWERPPDKRSDLRSLLERACRYIQPRRLLIVLDQFEEFVILQDAERQQHLGQLLSSLREQPSAEVTFLLVFRSDYIGLIEKLSLPPLLQDTNWREVPPFTESAARDFIRGSGLQASDELLRDVLREAAETEQAKGLIRPVTVNLCGLVLGRFATGLPRGFRPGTLIRGFLHESITLPLVRDIAPNLIPQLITSYVTKRPRTVADLAEDTALDPAAVRGCLRVLGQPDRAIVRPIDRDQLTWEISHDFLVPLLDSITARWKISFWRRFRYWLPWVAAMSLAIAAVAASRWEPKPILELTKLGWQVRDTKSALELVFEGAPPPASLTWLRHIKLPLHVTLNDPPSVATLSEWRALKNLSTLTLHRGVGSPRILLADVSPLSDLTSLQSLNLSSTTITDVYPLKNLTNLSTLDLGDTNVTDISALKGLKNLSTLGLSFTQITDLSLLKDFTNLSTLTLTSSPVHDALPIKDLKNLSTLDITGSHISDIAPLEGLTNLSELSIGFTDITTLSPLKNLKKLKMLDIQGDAKISDISFIEGLTNLSELHLQGTNIGDIAPLKNLTKLSTLDLSATKIRNISALNVINNLSALDLSDTKISDISPLRGLKNLSRLELNATMVHDVSPLFGLTNLSTLSLLNTNVNNISALAHLKNLRISR